MTEVDVEHILDTYSLEEILELNDLTEEDVLIHLIKFRMVELPDPKPVDVE
jgi:hypothetical protein